MRISERAQQAILAAANELAQTVADLVAREALPSLIRDLHDAVEKVAGGQVRSVSRPPAQPAAARRSGRRGGRPADPAKLVERLVVLLHASRGVVTPREVSARLKLSKAMRMRLLTQAIADGRVRREGSRRTTRYVLA